MNLTVIHESVILGRGTVVWQFASIGAGTMIGHDCVVGSCVYIGKDCKIGNNGPVWMKIRSSYCPPQLTITIRFFDPRKNWLFQI